VAIFCVAANGSQGGICHRDGIDHDVTRKGESGKSLI
jgi:hypothetical protein